MANRPLSEDEIDEQLRLGVKKQLLAYVNNAIPRNKQVDDLIDIWKQINTQLQLVCAERKIKMRLIELLPKEKRNKNIETMAKVLLHGQ